MAIDLRTYLVDDLLTLTDRVSMAHSLEVRVPFLDHEVVEFFWGIPSHLKLKRLTTKYLLKKAAERFLPKAVIYRRKRGFSIPLTVWFRGALRDYLEDTLGQASLRHIGFFNSQYIQTLLDEHRNAKANHDEKLFALLSFVTWYRMYMR
jgi:asparagine synthase (glutamine-hydrolysing)